MCLTILRVYINVCIIIAENNKRKVITLPHVRTKDSPLLQLVNISHETPATDRNDPSTAGCLIVELLL